MSKLTWALGLAIGAVGLMGTTSEAQAGGHFGISYTGNNYGIGYSNYPPPVVVRSAPVIVQPDCHYHVYFRDCGYGPWRLQGTYHNHHRAHHVAQSLRYQGLQARVNHH